MKFKKKKIFITGSSSGIGYQIASRFASLGFEVIINSKNKSRLTKASKSLNNCDYFVADLTKENLIKKMFLNIKKKHGYLDLLICNYGNSNYTKNHLDFYHAFTQNFFPTANTIKYGLPLLKNNKSKIICISSICGIENIKNAPIGYSVAKAAVNNYSKSMSSIIAEKGLAINTLALGNVMFKDSLWDKKMRKNYSKTRKYILDNVPMNKFASIDDIFDICNFLFKQESNFITGSTFIVDGGQTRKF